MPERERRRPPSLSVAELLASFPPPVSACSQALRGVIRELAPELEERVYPGWRGIGYRDERRGYVFGIFPRPDAVRLVFERGRELSDPDGELLGSGSQTRYLELDPDEALPRAAVARFVGRALR